MGLHQTQTSISLQKWHQGEAEGLSELIKRHLPWIHAHVRKRLGKDLRKKAESVDFVQDAMVQFLKYGPRIHISDDAQFRALLKRIVENAVRDRNDWFRAKRRNMSRECPLPSDTVLDLDSAVKTDRTPSQSAQRQEHEAWVRLGLELLDPDDRQVIVLRQWEKASFQAIAQQFDMKADAIRMRYNRALGKLSDKIGEIRFNRTNPSEEGGAT